MLERVWRKGNLQPYLECKLIQPLWRTERSFLKKLKIELPYYPAIPLLGKYPEKTIIQKDTCTPMFIAALFTIARIYVSGSVQHYWMVAHQSLLSMGVSRQEYCSRLLCPPPGDLPDPGIKPGVLHLLHWQAGSWPLAPPGKPITQLRCISKEWFQSAQTLTSSHTRKALNSLIWDI